ETTGGATAIGHILAIFKHSSVVIAPPSCQLELNFSSHLEASCSTYLPSLVKIDMVVRPR
ncbi:hypothetical protein, partial [Salmonella sp. gx-f7]|uniref:hypothetical protein n=1 Tax=Salmonella sp. gx-f7 TaxID=2582606 RepID=UPI001F25AEC4